ncbi:MAG: hypothetical protein ACYCU5_16720, partial [Actinomycetes bacterium]
LFTGKEKTFRVGSFPGPVAFVSGRVWVSQVHPLRVAVYTTTGKLLAAMPVKGMVSQFIAAPRDPGEVIAVNALTHQLLWLRVRAGTLKGGDG